MLPKGWKKASVREMGEVHAGRQRSPGFTKGELTPYLRVANVFDGRIDATDLNRMPFTKEEFARYKLEHNDILLNEGQSLELVGRPAMYRGTPKNCCFQNTLVRFRPSANVVPDFALKRFQLCLYDGTFQGIAKKTTSIAHLGVSRFADLKLNWPPLEEQKKIAEVLEAWSNAILVSEKLLLNCRKQKLALMQQLLTGKRRLDPSWNTSNRQVTTHGTIPEDWSYPRIESIAQDISLKHSSRADYPVLSCTKHGGLVDSLKYFKKRVFSENLATYKVAPRGSFVYATNHIEEGSIGYQNLYDIGLVSPMYTVFKTNSDVDDRYLYCLLKTEHYRQIFAAVTNASVDRRGSLRWNQFKKLHIPLPPIEEQHRIADLLDLADHDIKLFDGQLESLRSEKAVLMQQLLTGKRRVHLVEDATEPAG